MERGLGQLTRIPIVSLNPRLGSLAGGRRNNFDFLRFVAAILVIFGHSYAIAIGSLADEPLWRFSGQQFHSGILAVRIFFIISGFLIAASYDRVGQVAVFARNRALRIFPGLVAAVVVTMLVIGPLATTLPLSAYFRDPQTYAYLKTLTLRLHGANDLLPGVFKGNPLAGSVNGSLWTLFYEVVCYVFAGAIGAVGLLRQRVLLLVFVTSMVIRPVVLLIAPGSRLLGGESLYLGQCFAAGMLCYLYRDSIPINGRLMLIALTGWIAGTALGFGTLLLPVLGTYTIMVLAFSPRIRLHGFARRGDYSYGLYVYAFPVQQMIVQTVGRPMSHWWNFLIAVPITLLLAFLSWNLVEKRFLALKPHP